MGGLKKYLPVTYATMMVGTLAIAGIPPLSGFFSKDEILFRAFLSYKVIWVLAVVTALMTAFYMFRLMSMTFFGAYNGPAWDTGRAAPPRDARLAAAHGAPHPSDPHAHGQGHLKDHEVAHGPVEPHGHAHDDAGHGHGHGPWHGPHESPTPMTFPLMALAVGAVVAGLVGIPAALWSPGSAIERFLEPSFTAEVRLKGDPTPAGAVAGDIRGVRLQADQPAAELPEHEAGGAHVSRGVELGLMAFSVLVGLGGIGLAYKFYVVSPEISERLAVQWAGAHRLLSNKYYVDELYNATAVWLTFAGGRVLWLFDRRVVDGAVNGSGWFTIISAWFSGLADRTIVDGLVNLVGRICEEGSFWLRRLQSGLVQIYALLMLLGVFAFVTMYLFLR